MWFMICAMAYAAPTDIPIILFGAFDRHNFGDLLFPHIAAALLPGKNLIHAGLAERDLRPHGGHQVHALSRLAAELGDQPVSLLHVGGELLTCDAWQAALMLQAPAQAADFVTRLDAHAAERQAWANGILGLRDLAPYTVARRLFPGMARLAYNGVGGVDLGKCEAALRAEVLAKLREADEVGVRDRLTQAQLATAGISARLMPDPAVMVAELFGARIAQQARDGEVAQLRQAFPQGYIAVQFSADFGDDATLTEIAAQLDRIVHETGLGIVFFRAGAAPWHDDLAIYRRTAQRMSGAQRILESLDVWDICALIAHSRAYCGSSLHGRIVAMAYGLPRLNLLHPAQSHQATKQAAYAASWDMAEMPATVEIAEMAQGMRQALAIPAEKLREIARNLVACYRQSFSEILARMD